MSQSRDDIATADDQQYVVVRVRIPWQKRGGGFSALKAQSKTTVGQLKISAIDKIRRKRVSIDEQSLMSAIMNPKDYELVYAPTVNESLQASPDVSRSSVSRRSDSGIVAQTANSPRPTGQPDGVNGPCITPDETEKVWDVLGTTLNSAAGEFILLRKYTVIKVRIGDDLGGGFLSLEVELNTTAMMLKQRCLQKIKQKRLSFLEAWRIAELLPANFQIKLFNSTQPPVGSLPAARSNPDSASSKQKKQLMATMTIPDSSLVLPEIFKYASGSTNQGHHEVILDRTLGRQQQAAVEISIGTQTGGFLEASGLGGLKISELNNACNWTMALIESKDDDGKEELMTKKTLRLYFLDAVGRYLVVDEQDQVFTQKARATTAEWIVEDRKYLRSFNGTYLTVGENGNVRCGGRTERIVFVFMHSVFQGPVKRKIPKRKGFEKAFQPRWCILSGAGMAFWKTQQFGCKMVPPDECISLADIKSASLSTKVIKTKIGRRSSNGADSKLKDARFELSLKDGSTVSVLAEHADACRNWLAYLQTKLRVKSMEEDEQGERGSSERKKSSKLRLSSTNSLSTNMIIEETGSDEDGSCENLNETEIENEKTWSLIER